MGGKGKGKGGTWDRPQSMYVGRQPKQMRYDTDGGKRCLWLRGVRWVGDARGQCYTCGIQWTRCPGLPQNDHGAQHHAVLISGQRGHDRTNKVRKCPH